MNSNLCPCRSGLLYADCHGLARIEHYSAGPPEPLSYRAPRHLNPEQLAALAANLSRESDYDVIPAANNRLHFRLRSPVQWLLHSPVLRGPDKVSLWYEDPPLQQATIWPIGQLYGAADRAQAFDRLAGIRQSTLEWLRQFQGDLLLTLVRNEPTPMATALRAAIPVIRRHFPLAYIDCLSIHQRCVSAPRTPVFLAQLRHMPFHDIQARIIGSRERSGPAYVLFDPDPFFAILGNLSYPHISGFTIRHGSFALHLRYGERVMLPPTSLAERQVRDVSAPLLSSRGQDYVTSQLDVTPARHFLDLWLTRRLNVLFSSLAYLGTFASHTGIIDPEYQWQSMVAVFDIAHLTSLLITEGDPALWGILFFGIVDRYAGLGDRSPGDILSKPFFDQIADSLDPDLVRHVPALRDYVREAWQRIASKLWRGLYDEGARTSGRLEIRSPDGALEETLDQDRFASAILLAIRNTTHGTLRGPTFAKYLSRHSNSLPGEVREVGIALWLALVSCPQLLWGERAHFERTTVVLIPPEGSPPPVGTAVT